MHFSCACLMFLTGKYEQNVHFATFAVVRACWQIMPMSFIFSSLYGICVLPPMLRNPFICFLRACCLSAYRPSVWIFFYPCVRCGIQWPFSWVHLLTLGIARTENKNSFHKCLQRNSIHLILTSAISVIVSLAYVIVLSISVPVV